MTEDHKERIDRELNELLEEVRVAIPGAEVLFAFLLGVAFTALLIAPSAYHRLRFRGGDKERLLVSATRMAVASLLLLALAVSGVVFLVADLLYARGAAMVAGVTTAGWFLWFWFGLPITRRLRDARSPAPPSS
jgi:hypothetical protein